MSVPTLKESSKRPKAMPAMIKELRDQNLSKGWRGRDSYLNKMKAVMHIYTHTDIQLQ